MLMYIENVFMCLPYSLAGDAGESGIVSNWSTSGTNAGARKTLCSIGAGLADELELLDDEVDELLDDEVDELLDDEDVEETDEPVGDGGAGCPEVTTRNRHNRISIVRIVQQERS